MKVKLLTSLSGPDFNYHVDDEVDFENAEAIRLCLAEIASPANPAAKKTLKAYLDKQNKEEGGDQDK